MIQVELVSTFFIGWVYINYIVKQVMHCRIHLYSDDTVLYFSHNDV